MARFTLKLLLLTAFLGSATGLTLAVHHHESDSHHDSQHCSICVLSAVDKIVAAEGTPIESRSQFPLFCQPILLEVPALTFLNLSSSPRAPPLA